MKIIQKISINIATFSFMFMVPVMALAQKKGGKYFGEVDTFFTNIGGFIDDILIPLLFTVALLFFVYGMFRYFVLGAANEESRQKGRSIMWWSILGFVLMVSIWGIVNIISSGLFGNTQPPDIPGTPTLSGGGNNTGTRSFGGSAAPYLNPDSSGAQ
jgi:uncharacterized membrane-anchored protein